MIQQAKSNKRIKIHQYLLNLPYWFKVALWCLVVLITMEIFLRGTTLWTNGNYTYSPILENKRTKDSWILWGKEGYGITYYSSIGEIATPFEGGNPNIVVLGDSLTEGLQVYDSEKFVSVAEAKLRQNGFNADLHNWGQSSLCLADYIYIAPYIIEKFNPPIVVIQASIIEFDGSEGFESNRINYFEIAQDGVLSVKHKGSKRADLFPGVVRRFFSILDYGMARFETIEKQATNPLNNKTEAVVESGNIIPKIAIVQKINALLRQSYGEVKLVYILIPPMPGITENSLGNSDYSQYLEIKRELMSTPNVQVVDPLDAFQNSIINNQFPQGFNNSIPGTGHLNTTGHKIIGELLASQLSGLLSSYKNQGLQ